MIFSETFISYFYWNYEIKYPSNVLKLKNCEIKHPQNVIFFQSRNQIPTKFNTLKVLQTPSKTRERQRERSTSINSIPDYGESSKIDTIYEKIKIQSFKDNILQNLCEYISEIFDAELYSSVLKLGGDYNKIIDQLEDELKSRDHIIKKLRTTIVDLTSSELKSKDNFIHKLIN